MKLAAGKGITSQSQSIPKRQQLSTRNSIGSQRHSTTEAAFYAPVMSFPFSPSSHNIRSQPSAHNSSSVNRASDTPGLRLEFNHEERVAIRVPLPSPAQHASSSQYPLQRELRPQHSFTGGYHGSIAVSFHRE